MSKHQHASKHQAETRPPSTSGDPGLTLRAGAAHDAHDGANPAPTSDEIALLAYEIWIVRGRPEGDDLAHWFEAERRLHAGDPDRQVHPDGATGLAGREPGHRPGHDGGGRPHPTHAQVAEQAREAMENEQARQAAPSRRERMVDIGRGNQQAGRGGS